VSQKKICYHFFAIVARLCIVFWRKIAIQILYLYDIHKLYTDTKGKFPWTF
ncbi:hypothetical protein HMPREF1375_00709, partial [Enterococcus faecium P1986]